MNYSKIKVRITPVFLDILEKKTTIEYLYIFVFYFPQLLVYSCEAFFSSFFGGKESWLHCKLVGRGVMFVNGKHHSSNTQNSSFNDIFLEQLSLHAWGGTQEQVNKVSEYASSCMDFGRGMHG